MKKIFIAMLAIMGLATYVQAQTAYNMNVKLRSGDVHSFAADDVEEVTFTEQEPVVEEEFNILSPIYIPDGTFLNFIRDEIANGSNVFTNIQAKNYRGAMFVKAASQVTNFKGIEYFVNLDSLKVWGNEAATSIDLTALKNLSYLQLSQCTKLQEVKIGDIDKIKFLDIAMSTNLSNIIANTDNSAIITSVGAGIIDLSNRKQLEYFDAGAISKITEVNVAGCENLKHINTYATSISGIDLTGCNSLEGLYIQDNKNIYDVDISHLKDVLVHLNLRNTNISAMNLSGFSKLEQCNLQGCARLLSVNVDGCVSLKTFRTDGAYPSSIDLRDCSKLTEVHVFNNDLLTNFQIGDCPDLVYLNVFNTAITTLYLGEMPKLYQLWAHNNPNLTKIDISKVKQEGPYLYYLDFNPSLSEIKVWSTFDINNPPQGFYKDDSASYVFEFSE